MKFTRLVAVPCAWMSPLTMLPSAPVQETVTGRKLCSVLPSSATGKGAADFAGYVGMQVVGMQVVGMRCLPWNRHALWDKGTICNRPCLLGAQNFGNPEVICQPCHCLALHISAHMGLSQMSAPPPPPTKVASLWKAKVDAPKRDTSSCRRQWMGNKFVCWTPRIVHWAIWADRHGQLNNSHQLGTNSESASPSQV